MYVYSTELCINIRTFYSSAILSSILICKSTLCFCYYQWIIGIIAIFSAILILLAMPFTDLSRSRSIQFRPLNKAAFLLLLNVLK